MKSINKNINKTNDFFDNNKRSIKELNNKFLEAYKDGTKAKNDKLILEQWEKQFKAFQIDDEDEMGEKAFNIVLSYQYYDIPYDIHLFLPKIKEKDKDIRPFELPLSCFAISLTEKTELDVEYVAVFKSLSTVLENFCIMDRRIWEKHVASTLIYNTWQQVYDVIGERFKRLLLIVESICYAVCKNSLKSEQTDYIITSRIKSIQSLYSKIAREINGIKAKSDREEKIKKLNLIPELQEQNEEKPKKTIDLAFEIIKNLEIKDIAGLRIICKYDEDIYKIKTEFEKALINQGELEKIGEIKEYTFDKKENPEYYRSIHITVGFGKVRKTLYEVKDIPELIAEIQIRSTLAHGWADVSHDISYKPKLPEKHAEIYRKSVKSKLITKARELKKIDKVFCGLRMEYKKTYNKFNEGTKKGLK
ncbi:MAG: GTP pyrophosphokinase YjbM [Candidatus Scalindua rubra]|uniref:GTP pyrophosphokinase YjbM n=1 Tax=Candidatus Scalindua rubra TaxID=1872076 RepID=A0A1E3X5V0_9BACT|nr:MAG: GTP pyrophosphokinase YjbM [Candidatus Scalindua rubra]